MTDKTGGSAAIGYDWRANSPHPKAIDPYGGPEPESLDPDLWTQEQSSLMAEVFEQLDHLPSPTTQEGRPATEQGTKRGRTLPTIWASPQYASPPRRVGVCQARRTYSHEQ
jgi:hypothetical protein